MFVGPGEHIWDCANTLLAWTRAGLCGPMPCCQFVCWCVHSQSEEHDEIGQLSQLSRRSNCNKILELWKLQMSRVPVGDSSSCRAPSCVPGYCFGINLDVGVPPMFHHLQGYNLLVGILSQHPPTVVATFCSEEQGDCSNLGLLNESHGVFF